LYKIYVTLTSKTIKAKMGNAYFRNIRKELIDALYQSEKEIQIAVAWFTNEKLFDTLINCLEKGTKVSLIIINDYINNGNYGLNFQLFIDRGGTLIYGNMDNPMHHKFCIIDNSILFTGSYNWTYYAENRNFENIVRLEERDLIDQYIQEFEMLKKQLGVVNKANKILFDDIEKIDFFSTTNYIGLDLTYKSKETSNIKYIEDAIKILPESVFVKKMYQSFNPSASVENQNLLHTQSVITQPFIKRTINSIGIKSWINGVDNQFSIIIPQGSEIPCEFSKTFFTQYNNQKSMNIETFKGEDNNADKNIRLGKFSINDLPSKFAGKASVSVIIAVDENLRLIIKAKSNDTGNEMEANYYDNEIAE
jgi:hypothetical protein